MDGLTVDVWGYVFTYLCTRDLVRLSGTSVHMRWLLRKGPDAQRLLGNRLFRCERDDGVTDMVAGWGHLMHAVSGGPRITDAGMAALATVRHMLGIRVLPNRNITDAGVRMLVVAPFFENLGVCKREAMGDEAVAIMAAALPLRRADFIGCRRLTDASAQTLALMPFITVVALGYTGVSDAGVAALAAAPCLTILDVSGTSVSVLGTTALSQSTTLTSLHMVECPNVDDDAIVALSTLPTLQNLEISRCRLVGDNAMIGLAKLPNLQILRIRACGGITALGFRALAGAPALTKLWAGGTTVGGTLALSAIAKSRTIKDLHFVGCMNMNDENLMLLADMPLLQVLDTQMCRDVTVGGREALRRAIPGLRHIASDVQAAPIPPKAIASLMFRTPGRVHRGERVGRRFG